MSASVTSGIHNKTIKAKRVDFKPGEDAKNATVNGQFANIKKDIINLNNNGMSFADIQSKAEKEARDIQPEEPQWEIPRLNGWVPTYDASTHHILWDAGGSISYKGRIFALPGNPTYVGVGGSADEWVVYVSFSGNWFDSSDKDYLKPGKQRTAEIAVQHYPSGNGGFSSADDVSQWHDSVGVAGSVTNFVLAVLLHTSTGPDTYHLSVINQHDLIHGNMIQSGSIGANRVQAASLDATKFQTAVTDTFFTDKAASDNLEGWLTSTTQIDGTKIKEVTIKGTSVSSNDLFNQTCMINSTGSLSNQEQGTVHNIANKKTYKDGKEGFFFGYDNTTSNFAFEVSDKAGRGIFYDVTDKFAMEFVPSQNGETSAWSHLSSDASINVYSSELAYTGGWIYFREDPSQVSTTVEVSCDLQFSCKHASNNYPENLQLELYIRDRDELTNYRQVGLARKFSANFSTAAEGRKNSISYGATHEASSGISFLSEIGTYFSIRDMDTISFSASNRIVLPQSLATFVGLQYIYVDDPVGLNTGYYAISEIIDLGGDPSNYSLVVSKILSDYSLTLPAITQQPAGNPISIFPAARYLLKANLPDVSLQDEWEVSATLNKSRSLVKINQNLR